MTESKPPTFDVRGYNRDLHRYVSEIEFRYNSRHVADDVRTQRAMQAAVGARLTYNDQIGG